MKEPKPATGQRLAVASEWTVDGPFVCIGDGNSCLCVNPHQANAIADAHNAALAAKSLESSKELLMERDELKQQLAVAQAALKEIAGPDQGSVIAWQIAEKALAGDTTALDAAIAEAVAKEGK
jgi:hypothetical protein